MPMHRLWRAAFWLLLAATLWLSLVPVAQVPAGLAFWDKAQHAGGFAALAYTGLRAHGPRLLLLALGLALLGAGIEVAQWLSGWRTGDWQDWLADCVGLLAGYLAWRVWRALRASRPGA